METAVTARCAKLTSDHSMLFNNLEHRFFFFFFGGGCFKFHFDMYMYVYVNTLALYWCRSQVYLIQKMVSYLDSLADELS